MSNHPTRGCMQFETSPAGAGEFSDHATACSVLERHIEGSRSEQRSSACRRCNVRRDRRLPNHARPSDRSRLPRGLAGRARGVRIARSKHWPTSVMFRIGLAENLRRARYHDASRSNSRNLLLEPVHDSKELLERAWRGEFGDGKRRLCAGSVESDLDLQDPVETSQEVLACGL